MLITMDHYPSDIIALSLLYSNFDLKIDSSSTALAISELIILVVLVTVSAV